MAKKAAIATGSIAGGGAAELEDSKLAMCSLLMSAMEVGMGTLVGSLGFRCSSTDAPCGFKCGFRFQMRG